MDELQRIDSDPRCRVSSTGSWLPSRTEDDAEPTDE